MNTTETIEKLKVLAEECAAYRLRDNVKTIRSAITLLQNKEKDTERLDWLEQNTGDHANPAVFTAWNLPSTLREAIDSAIAAQQEAESV